VTTQIEEERKLKLPRPPKPKLPEPPDLTLPGQTVATNLSAQLGSDAKVLSLGEFDMRRLSYIDEQQLQALAYFSWRGQKVRFWKHIVDQVLNLSVSIKGLGRKQLIEMQRASTGAPSPLPEEERSWFERHILRRGKKEEE